MDFCNAVRRLNQELARVNVPPRWACLLVEALNSLNDIVVKNLGPLARQKIPVRIHRVSGTAKLPTQANEGDAGWDCYADQDVEFYPGEVKLVSLGIIAEAPVGYHFKLCLRSSMGLKRGFSIPNAPGIIDSRYSGPTDVIKVILKAPETDRTINDGAFFPLKILRGDKICQLILEKNNDIEWIEQDRQDFASTESRGGFGSSGVR